ncbi:hypothetical protein GOODEAATRI_016627 [Goodea atripinnis]|uniref:Uncharacterized protein n=1 Tax=Goodea atripinnis TaxID=208336 RepID=A0ABV0PP58_9TELE
MSSNLSEMSHCRKEGQDVCMSSQPPVDYSRLVFIQAWVLLDVFPCWNSFPSHCHHKLAQYGGLQQSQSLYAVGWAVFSNSFNILNLVSLCYSPLNIRGRKDVQVMFILSPSP